MRHLRDAGQTVALATRDLAQAGNRVAVAATAVALAATVMIAIVAPI